MFLSIVYVIIFIYYIYYSMHCKKWLACQKSLWAQPSGGAVDWVLSYLEGETGDNTPEMNQSPEQPFENIKLFKAVDIHGCK